MIAMLLLVGFLQSRAVQHRADLFLTSAAQTWLQQQGNALHQRLSEMGINPILPNLSGRNIAILVVGTVLILLLRLLPGRRRRG